LLSLNLKRFFVPVFLSLDGIIWYYQTTEQISLPDFIPFPVVSTTLMELVTNKMLVFFMILLLATIFIRISIFFSRFRIFKFFLKRTVIALVLISIYTMYEVFLWLLDTTIIFTVPVIRQQVTLPLIVPDIIAVVNINNLWFMFIIIVYSVFIGLSILMPLNQGNFTFRIIYFLLRIVIPLKFTELHVNTELKLTEDLSLNNI